MKNDITEIVFVLDRSGSMSGLESDTIGGFNGLLEKQKNGEGRAYVTTVLFDNTVEVLHDHLDIELVDRLTEDDYYARGCTALYDAVGYSIEKMDRIVKYSKTDKVIFVIITDGYENSSRQYSKRDVKGMISAREEKGWQFMFLGANIDAADAAEDIGISRKKAANYHNDSEGVNNNFQVLGMMVKSARCASSQEEVEACCEAVMVDLNDDYKNRK